MDKVFSVHPFSLFVLLMLMCFANFNTAEVTDYYGLESVAQDFLFPKNRAGILMTRIIGGSITASHQYPFQVALIVWIGTETYFCGGSLISRSWVLTAAHCLDGVELAQVTLGAYDLSSTESMRITMNSTTFIIHELWDSDTLQNDVALIELPRSVTLNSYINTVSIANGNDTYAGELGLVIGWGLTSLGTMSSILRHVNTTVMTNEACAEVDPYQTVIVESHICTSGDGIVGSCSGDSGGPLLVNGVQIGIVSFGYSSCTVSKPSVYARLTDYREWIETYAIEEESAFDTDGGNTGGSFANKCKPSLICQLLIVVFVYLFKS